MNDIRFLPYYQLQIKMITNISRQLTTGALAIAGTVAAFGFAGTAPVQAQALCTSQSFTTFMTTPCRRTDKLFTYINSSGSTISDIGNFLGITHSTMMPIHSFTFTPADPLNTMMGSHTISYSVEIVNDPLTPENEALTQMFSTFSAGYTATGNTNFGISLQKEVWSDGIAGAVLLGTSSASSATSSVGNVVTVPTGTTKIFVRDTFGVSSPSGSLNNITNVFTQQARQSISEPSGVLGIFAVAGVGFFLRRKS
ncbi:PEP-CTERM sorting domain-containing protein [Microcystis aeruginosa]|uniref:PEP-CTERM sorting domain-containing protein n=1 Tax=Microcystis aeruginosa TaxID=1126 RepID=UPI0020A35A29|nr:PEP-CTERM sorting domain-containing protein [Microcystis aeruginosa]